MNHEELEKLSVPELIAMILQQQATLEEQQAILAQREGENAPRRAWVAELEGQVGVLEARLAEPAKASPHSSVPPAKGWFVFLSRTDVPPDNNASERALRHSVVPRKGSGGFRSAWGAAA